MTRITAVKRKVRHGEWAEQIKECQSSGKKVSEWCKENGISSNTYYRRLRIIREEMLQERMLQEHMQPGIQSIVPISTSRATVAQPQEYPVTKIEEAYAEKVFIRKDGIEIELPQGVSETTISALLRGLKEC